MVIDMWICEKNARCVDECDDCQHYIEVEPVRHGKWTPIINPPTWEFAFHKLVGYQCSLCGRIEKNNEPYCNCGAKMGGGE